MGPKVVHFKTPGASSLPQFHPSSSSSSSFLVGNYNMKLQATVELGGLHLLTYQACMFGVTEIAHTYMESKTLNIILKLPFNFRCEASIFSPLCFSRTRPKLQYFPSSSWLSTSKHSSRFFPLCSLSGLNFSFLIFKLSPVLWN